MYILYTGRFYFIFKILNVFNIVINVTPTSANTANAIFDNPITLNIKTNTFTPSANIKFYSLNFYPAENKPRWS